MKERRIREVFDVCFIKIKEVFDWNNILDVYFIYVGNIVLKIKVVK